MLFPSPEKDGYKKKQYSSDLDKANLSAMRINQHLEILGWIRA
jgi:hypothetical protein